MEEINVLGICGREGAGKTTVANILQFGSHESSNETNWVMREIENPLIYIAHVLFGFPLHTDSLRMKDPIWGMTQGKAFEVISDILVKYVDKDWFTKHPTGFKFQVPFPVLKNDRKWVEFSMADPLKRICALIFDIPYEILLAQTPETRQQREVMLSPPQSVCGQVTGRYCLEYFGTDVMRNNFDNDIWIKILEREAKTTMTLGHKVVIPDIRFPNEGKMIDNLGGTLMTIYRASKDLDLTEEDEKTHPAKWKFITFRKNVKNPIIVRNNGTMEELHSTLHDILQF
jgi:hypothetical protein